MRESISVIIPVYNGAAHLEACLSALSASQTAPLEVIVVDDGSTDNSREIAARFGATVLSTNGRRGPAVARNLGVRQANGDIVLFLDSDVCVYPDTISKVADEFSWHPAVDAVMGSYDSLPSAPNFMSQYRNLMHCFVHQNANREASTFWAGCGAIRRKAFLEFGGFDEHFRSPAIEDVELGYRLSAAGRKIVMRPDILVKHLKRWSMRNMLKTDFYYRALPWSDLAIRSGSMPNDLNLRISQRISVALVFLLGSLGAYLALTRGAYFLLPLFATFFLLLSYYWLECSKEHCTFIMGLMVGVTIAIAALAFVAKLWLIIPLLILAWIALFTRHRYALPLSVWHRRTGVAVGGYCILLMGFVWLYYPQHKSGTVWLVVLLTLVTLNKQFYLFLAGHRGRLFALAAIPFHLLYFMSSGLAFSLAMAHYQLERLQGLRPGASRFTARRPRRNPT